MPEHFEVAIDVPLSFEVPALVLSVLAYPDAKDAAKRGLLYQALCFWLIEQRCGRDQAWAEYEIPIKPSVLELPHLVRQAAMRKFERQVAARQRAGRVAIAFLKEAVTGKLPPLPGTAKRPSINELVVALADNVTTADAANIKTRIWRPSRPVVHVAAALEVCFAQVLAETGRSPTIDELYGDGSLLPQVLETAAIFEDLLVLSRAKIASDDLTKFRMRSVGSKTESVSELDCPP